MSRLVFCFLFAFTLPAFGIGSDVVLPTYPDTVAASRLESAFLSMTPVTEKPNSVFSPFSILAVLSLAAEGASNGALELLRNLVGDVLCYRIPTSLSGWDFRYQLESLHRIVEAEDFPSLELVSRVYVDEELREKDAFKEFKQTVETKLNAPAVQTADFTNPASAAAEMNQLVSETTQGRIPSLISPVMLTGARLVLLNALYFKSGWRSYFDPDDTKKGIFQSVTSEGFQAKEVSFMKQTFDGHAAHFHREKDVEVVALPYTYPGAWMILYKPADLKAFEEKLAAAEENHLSRLAGLARQHHEDIEGKGLPSLNLSLPKFSLLADDNRLDGEELLKRLGLGDLMGAAGGFEGIGGKGSQLHISSFQHQADIRVDEAGTQAAAATAMIATDGAFLPKEKVTIEFNQPFLFEIRLQLSSDAEPAQDLILFAGRVADPEV